VPPLPEPLLGYVNHGREERNLEFKERLEWQTRRAGRRAAVTAHQTNIIKSVMAMSNIRHGGVIVVGVRDADGQPVGLDERTARRFNQDAVSAIVNEYAAPYCEITVTAGHLPNDDTRWFVVLDVQEFATQPIICRRDGPTGLERGAVFVRGRRIYESAKVRSEAEMREIVELAVEKRVDREVSALLRRLTPLIQLPQVETTDRERYDVERGPL